MGIGQKIIDMINNHRDRKIKKEPGAIGQFWRDGGNQLLYDDLPVTVGDLIIDAGGYKGEWSIQMIARFGCVSEIFEPAPEYFDYCRNYFKNNSNVVVHKAALGGKNRKTTFNHLGNGTSEYRGDGEAFSFEAEVIDVASILSKEDSRIACFKLNIEGGEYEVLERMIQCKIITSCDSLIIQFHRQPEGYQDRYARIADELRKTHIQCWRYEMVWEKWVHKNIPSR